MFGSIISTSQWPGSKFWTIKEENVTYWLNLGLFVFFSICFNCPALIWTWCFCTRGLLSVHVQGGLHHNLRKRKWWTQRVDSNLHPAVHRKPIELSVSEQMKLDEAGVRCARSIFNLRISICRRRQYVVWHVFANHPKTWVASGAALCCQILFFPPCLYSGNQIN